MLAIAGHLLPSEISFTVMHLAQNPMQMCSTTPSARLAEIVFIPGRKRHHVTDTRTEKVQQTGLGHKQVKGCAHD